MRARAPARLATLLAAVVLAAACGSDDEEPITTVSVELGEFTISITPRAVNTGEVTFRIRNGGAQSHDFLLISTEEPQDALHVENGVVVEEDYDILEHVHEIDVGAERSVSSTLEAGTYLIICNVPGHYGAGMHAALTAS